MDQSVNTEKRGKGVAHIFDKRCLCGGLYISRRKGPEKAPKREEKCLQGGHTNTFRGSKDVFPNIFHRTTLLVHEGAGSIMNPP